MLKYTALTRQQLQQWCHLEHSLVLYQPDMISLGQDHMLTTEFCFSVNLLLLFIFLSVLCCLKKSVTCIFVSFLYTENIGVCQDWACTNTSWRADKAHSKNSKKDTAWQGPLEAILVIFGCRALIFFCLKDLGKYENDITFVRMRSGDHLEDANM